MKGIIFTFAVILLVAKIGHCWVCPSNTRIFTDIGQRPVLPFNTNGRHTEGDTADINTFNIYTHTGTNMLTVNYENGVALGDPYTNGCSLASSAVLANGVLNIQLDTVMTSDRGTYRLMHTRSAVTVTQCVTLYLLGTPTTPTFSPSGTHYEGTLLSLTCSSTPTTQPSNHSLVMSYAWTKNGSMVTADNKFSFDSNLQKTLTISSLSRTEDNNNIMGCTATEVDGKSSLATSYTINVQYGPDDIHFNPPGDSKSYNDGDAFIPVSCLADCQPNCSFSWRKGGTLLSSTAVLNLGVVHSGKLVTYTCTATHTVPVHTMTKTLDVSVIYGPGSVSLSPSTTNYTVTEGDTSVIITCIAMCNPECTYTWLKSGTTVSSTGILDLGQTKRGEAGSYVCTAKNPRSGVSRSGPEVNISVRYGPDDVTFDVPNVHTVTEGDTVNNIDCSADCWPGCVYTWINQTNNQPISTTEVLTFGTADRYDAGNYKCLARNSATQYTREAVNNFSLRVQYPPDVFISHSTTLWTENSPLDILCKASGVPALYNYTSFVQRVGDVVVPNSHAESPGVRDSISVNIPSLQLQDTGIYTCYVHNGITGLNEQLIQYASRRIEVPAPPNFFLEETNYAGEKSGNITISIPFVSVPSYTSYSVLRHDGQPISTNGKYTLHIRNTFVHPVFYGQQVTLAGNVLQITIGDLSENDFGIFRIQITNDINTASLSIDIKAKSKPFPPTELNLTTLNNTVTFEWNKGFNGGHEQTFVVEISLNSGDSWTNIISVKESESKYKKENGKFQVHLTNVDPGVYNARIVAFNIIGAADPVEFKTGFEIMAFNKESSARNSVGPAIAGTIGGIVAAFVVAIVIVVIFRRKFTCTIIIAKRGDLNQDTHSEQRTDAQGVDDSRFNATQMYEAVPMTTDKGVYAELKNGNNCPDISHVYSPLDESSLKSHTSYENVKTGK